MFWRRGPLHEEWKREEREGFSHAEKVLREALQEGEARLSTLFPQLFPELKDRLDDSRGVWNTTLSLYTVYHFYRQAILVVSPVGSEDEFKKTYKVEPQEIARLVKEGRLILLTAAPQYHYKCRCFHELLKAQESLPTILRLTETLKALLYEAKNDKIYNTKELYNKLRGPYSRSGLSDYISDSATRISDLAMLGYKRLSEELLSLATNEPKRGYLAVRAAHHVLAEPVIDSGASIAAYSNVDVEFIEKALERGGPIGEAIALTLYSLKVEASLRVPRRVNASTIYRLTSSEAAQRTYNTVKILRDKLNTLPEKKDDALKEAKEIAKNAASHAVDLNRSIVSGVTSRINVAAGFIAQIPIPFLFSSLDDPILDTLVSLVASNIAGAAAGPAARRLAERLLFVEEHVNVAPVTPVIFEYKDKAKT